MASAACNRLGDPGGKPRGSANVWLNQRTELTGVLPNQEQYAAQVSWEQGIKASSTCFSYSESFLMSFQVFATTRRELIPPAYGDDGALSLRNVRDKLPLMKPLRVLS